MQIPAVKTWVDFNRGGVISLEDDVLGVVRRIKAIDDRLQVFYNEQSGEFDIVEQCLDGVDRLVLSTAKLDQRVVDRLLRADHWSDGRRDSDDDFLAEIDKSNNELLAEKDEENRERLRDAQERLAHALGVSTTKVHFPAERSISAETGQGGASD